MNDTMQTTTTEATLTTLPDGRIFPCLNGEVLPWALGSHFTLRDEQEGYPRTRMQIAALRQHKPEVLEYERRELVKSKLSNRLFGHHADRLLKLIESVH